MEAGKTLLDRAIDKCGTAYQLSKLTGVSQGNLSDMLRGNRPMPPRLAGELAALVGDDPREAALAEIVAQEKRPEKQETLARLFKLRDWRRR